jgi:23S rRNA (cytosine1962-C5)-methyltransferase
MSESGIAAELPALRLRRNEDRRIQAGHLWVFSNEVDIQQTPLTRFTAGSLVRVLAHNDRALGLAYVNPKSLISARMLGTWKVPNTAWFAGRMRIALALRERLYADPYYRLVYGESDGLPGVIIDRYGTRCVVQIGTAGMEALKPQIHEALAQVLELDALLFKNDSGAREMEGLPSYVESALGDVGAIGSVVKYVRRGARVLDVFSYAGAWGVRAAHAGAAEVLCVDSSAAALELAVSNAARNSLELAVRKGDAFEVLESLAKENARFDVIIIDPPAFAKRRKDLPKALAAYKRLNQLAMRLLSDDAILVSCSCSYHVSAEELQDAIAKAARATDKHLQILEFGGQSPDHPVHPAIPETRYLKAYFCRVTDGLK